MKKILTGALLMGTMATAAYATPTGDVTIGFEQETNNSRNNGGDMILPYVKTKTFFNETTPYYVEANYSFRDQYNKSNNDKDNRQRYELFVGGYALTTENFAFTPKIGFRHEVFDNVEDGTANRTVLRFYPNMSYKLNDKNALSLSGFVATIPTERSGDAAAGDQGGDYDKKYTDYLHELEFAFAHKLNDSQVFTTSIYNEYEKNHYVQTNEIWELRFRLTHAMENGKTTVSPFVRLPLNRESRKVSAEGRETVDTNRIRVGASTNHKIDDSWSLFGEAYYQNTTSNTTSEGTTPSSNLYFINLAVKYSY